MSLTILSVAFALGRVTMDTAGGAEQILGLLDNAISEAGHHSLVIAREDSSVAGTLIRVPRFEGSFEIRETWAHAHQHHRAAVARALREWPVDLIHLHGLDFHEYLPADCDRPVLVTLHLPPEWYEAGSFLHNERIVFFNCVSDSQRHRCGRGVNLVETIHNGIPLHRFSFRARIHAQRASRRVIGPPPEKAIVVHKASSTAAATMKAPIANISQFVSVSIIAATAQSPPEAIMDVQNNFEKEEPLESPGQIRANSRYHQLSSDSPRAGLR